MTEQQVLDYIAANYLDVPIKRMAANLGHGQTYVRDRMGRLGLVVPPELAEARKRSGQYRKGQEPPNKGRPQAEWMPEESRQRSSRTTFKKGRLPHNTLHDGAETVRADKRGVPYRFRRVAPRRWVHVSRLNWEAAHGPVPRGFNVQFKDGDTMNDDIGNLYLVSRAEQAQHNKQGGSKLPHELKQTITLLNKIKRKTNEKQA